MRLERKEVPYDHSQWSSDVPEIVQQIYANRGVTSPHDILKDPALLLNPRDMKGVDVAAEIIVDAIIHQKHITIAGDYDCDGATGTTVGVKGLQLLGAQNVQFTIPNRDVHGYGLSVGLVEEMPQPTDLIITVDSGISSIEGVARAKELGYQVVVTDHHLPGDHLPNADAIVNPNQPGDTFPGKALAGVGVLFYTLLVVRAKLRERNHPGGIAPLFEELLPVVTIGTVADLVTLDQNNRILVAGGLRLIQAGRMSIGIQELLNSANKDPRYLTATDIAFGIAPRLNAAGRLADMTLGVKLLLTDSQEWARFYCEKLEGINATRKEIQAEMVTSAEAIADKIPATRTKLVEVIEPVKPGEAPKPPKIVEKVVESKGVVVFDKSFQGGIVGLVASKLKESLNRPVIAFAPGPNGLVRGSARSIPGLHLRDALALIDARHPGLLKKFGGHAMAAGMTIEEARIDEFDEIFNDTIDTLLTPEMMEAIVYSDGELNPIEMTVDFAKYLDTCGPWGQGFPKPVFDGVFEIQEYRVLKDTHLKMSLHDTRQGDLYDAIWFFSYKGLPPPQRFRMAYELDINRFRGRESVQLLVRLVEPLS